MVLRRVVVLGGDVGEDLDRRVEQAELDAGDEQAAHGLVDIGLR